MGQLGQARAAWCLTTGGAARGSRGGEARATWIGSRGPGVRGQGAEEKEGERRRREKRKEEKKKKKEKERKRERKKREARGGFLDGNRGAGWARTAVGRHAARRTEREKEKDGTTIEIGCRDGENFWVGIRGLGMIELNDEKVLKIIFSACFILVDFSGCDTNLDVLFHGGFTIPLQIINFRGVLPVHVSAVWNLKIPPRVQLFLASLRKQESD